MLSNTEKSPGDSNQKNNISTINYTSQTEGEGRVIHYGLVSRREFYYRKNMKSNQAVKTKYVSNEHTEKRKYQTIDVNSQELRPSKIYVSSSPGIRNKNIASSDYYSEGIKKPWLRGGIVKFRRKLKFSKQEDIEKIILIQTWWKYILYQKLYRKDMYYEKEDIIKGGVIELGDKEYYLEKQRKSLHPEPIITSSQNIPEDKQIIPKVPPQYISKEIKTKLREEKVEKEETNTNISLIHPEDPDTYYQRKIRPIWNEKNRSNSEVSLTYKDPKVIKQLNLDSSNNMTTLEFVPSAKPVIRDEVKNDNFDIYHPKDSVQYYKEKMRPIWNEENAPETNITFKSPIHQVVKKFEIDNLNSVEYEPSKKENKNEFDTMNSFGVYYPKDPIVYYKNQIKPIWNEENQLDNPDTNLSIKDPIKKYNLDNPNSFEIQGKPFTWKDSSFVREPFEINYVKDEEKRKVLKSKAPKKKKSEIKQDIGDSFEFTHPEDIKQYYKEKMKPIWDEDNDVITSASNMRYKDNKPKLDQDILNSLEYIPKAKPLEIAHIEDNTFEVLPPENLEQYYQLKMLPYWKRRVEPSKEEKELKEMFKDFEEMRLYYITKMKPIWNKENELYRIEDTVSIKDPGKQLERDTLSTLDYYPLPKQNKNQLDKCKEIEDINPKIPVSDYYKGKIRPIWNEEVELANSDVKVSYKDTRGPNELDNINSIEVVQPNEPIKYYKTKMIPIWKKESEPTKGEDEFKVEEPKEKYYYQNKIRPIWNKYNDVDTTTSTISINDPKKSKPVYQDSLNYIEYVPKAKPSEEEKSTGMEILHPEEPIKYYKTKIVPIWKEESEPEKKEDDMEMLHPNEPIKYYKSKMVPIWKREAEPEKKEEDVEMLHPDEPVKYYKSKMVPIWKREAEPSKNNDEIVKEPNDEYYYQNKIRPIWNEKNELDTQLSSISIRGDKGFKDLDFYKISSFEYKGKSKPILDFDSIESIEYKSLPKEVPVEEEKNDTIEMQYPKNKYAYYPKKILPIWKEINEPIKNEITLSYLNEPKENEKVSDASLSITEPKKPQQYYIQRLLPYWEENNEQVNQNINLSVQPKPKKLGLDSFDLVELNPKNLDTYYQMRIRPIWDEKNELSTQETSLSIKDPQKKMNCDTLNSFGIYNPEDPISYYKNQIRPIWNKENELNTNESNLSVKDPFKPYKWNEEEFVEEPFEIKFCNEEEEKDVVIKQTRRHIVRVKAKKPEKVEIEEDMGETFEFTHPEDAKQYYKDKMKPIWDEDNDVQTGANQIKYKDIVPLDMENNEMQYIAQPKKVVYNIDSMNSIEYNGEKKQPELEVEKSEDVELHYHPVNCFKNLENVYQDDMRFKLTEDIDTIEDERRKKPHILKGRRNDNKKSTSDELEITAPEEDSKIYYRKKMKPIWEEDNEPSKEVNAVSYYKPEEKKVFEVDNFNDFEFTPLPKKDNKEFEKNEELEVIHPDDHVRYYKEKMKQIWDDENEFNDESMGLSIRDPVKVVEKKEPTKEIEYNDEIEALHPQDPETYYPKKIRPIWNKNNELESASSLLSVQDPKKPKKLDTDDFNAFEFIPQPKPIIEEKNDDMEVIHPTNPVKYYKGKIVPIWKEESEPEKKEDDMEMLHPNEPVKYYKSKMVPIWKREAEPEKKEEDMKMLHPDEPVKYYKSKMVPIWKREAEPSKNNDEIVKEPNDEYYYQNKIRPIWNKKNELSTSEANLSIKDKVEKKPKRFDYIGYEKLGSFEVNPVKKERIEKIVNNEEIELLYPENPDKYYVYKIRPIWANKLDLETPVTNLSINDPKKQKKYDIDEFNYMEFIPEPKKIQQENNDEIEILHPEEPIKYYKTKIVPIWKEESEPEKKEEDMEMLHPNEPVKYYKSKMVPIWKREAEPEKKEEDVEMLHPDEPVKYYKSKMVPIWKREAEPSKNNDEIVKEPNDEYYYQNKIRPIWNEKNELDTIAANLSIKDPVKVEKPKVLSLDNHNEIEYHPVHKNKKFNIDSMNAFEFSPIKKTKPQMLEKFSDIQLLYPNNSTLYYKNKIKPIWNNENELTNSEIKLSFEAPQKKLKSKKKPVMEEEKNNDFELLQPYDQYYYRYKIRPIWNDNNDLSSSQFNVLTKPTKKKARNADFTDKIKREQVDEIEVLNPEDPISYYKSKIVPIWNDENEKDSVDRNTIKEPTKSYYYQYKIRSIWNSTNKEAISSESLSYQDPTAEKILRPNRASTLQIQSKPKKKEEPPCTEDHCYCHCHTVYKSKSIPPVNPHKSSDDEVIFNDEDRYSVEPEQDQNLKRNIIVKVTKIRNNEEEEEEKDIDIFSGMGSKKKPKLDKLFNNLKTSSIKSKSKDVIIKEDEPIYDPSNEAQTHILKSSKPKGGLSTKNKGNIYSPIDYNYEQPRSSVPIDQSIYTPSAPIKNAQDLLRKSVMKRKDNLLLREDNDDKNAFV